MALIAWTSGLVQNKGAIYLYVYLSIIGKVCEDGIQMNKL